MLTFQGLTDATYQELRIQLLAQLEGTTTRPIADGKEMVAAASGEGGAK
jgi:hypothetical protein